MFNRKTSIVVLISFCALIAGVAGVLVKAQSPTTYFYVATAVNSTGDESPRSNEATCAGITPAKPHCDLTWVASTSTVSGYNLYRSTISGGPYTKVNSAVITTLSFSDLPVNFPNPPTGLAAAPGSN